MVEGKEIASSVSFGSEGKKYAGSLSFFGSVKGGASPEDLELVWYEQVGCTRKNWFQTGS